MTDPHEGVSPEAAELTAPAAVHTPHPHSSAGTTAEDEPLERSYYLLEFFFEETPSNFDMGYLSADPAEIRAALEEEYDGTHLTAGIGEQVCLWATQRGVLTYGLDLNPFIRTRCADGVTRTLSDLREAHLADSFGDVRAGDSYTVDWDAIAPLLPPLTAPLAEPGDEELFLDVPDEFPAPDVPIEIDEHEFLEHGWTDL